MSGGLHELARQTGRGPDSHLIHMSTNELNALQGLAEANGGSLTINPTTGLPEAGFLDKILPTVLGIGLSPFVGPLAAAGIVGAGYGIAKGNLGEGLMAGLGAYGGANLAGTLSTLGQGGAAAAQAAGQEQVGQQLAANMAQNGANQTAAQALGQQQAAGLFNMGGQFSQMGLPSSLQGVPAEALANAGLNATQQAAYTAVQPNVPGAMRAGLGALRGSWKDIPQAWQAYTGGGLRGAAGLAGLAMPFMSTAPAEFDVPEDGEDPKYEGPYMPAKREYRSDNRALTPENSYEWRFFNKINPVPNVVPFKKYAAGGEVDGVSDSVPAMIDGQQPAALSQGEFVVPARVVAEIGNGSSDAGARKLAMMLSKVEQKMRTARRGEDSGADMVAAQTMGLA